MCCGRQAKIEWQIIQSPAFVMLAKTKCKFFKSILFLVFLLRFSLFVFLERGQGKEKERARNNNVWLGAWPETQACPLTGNRTSDPMVCSLRSVHWATPARAEVSYFAMFICGLTSMIVPLHYLCLICFNMSITNLERMLRSYLVQHPASKKVVPE